MRLIRQSTINVCAFAFLCAALPLLIFGGYMLRASMKNENAADNREKRTMLLGEDINAASDYLTDQVRTFIVMQDRMSLYAFWKEVDFTKRRDAAIAEAISRNVPPEEIDLLATAKRESDVLVVTETRAMRLVAEALAYTKEGVPRAVADAELGPKDEALSAAGKIGLACELVFDGAYQGHKQKIRDVVGQYRAISQQRTDTEARASQSAADLAFILVTALCLFIFLGGTSVIILYYRFVALPVREYIKTILDDEPVTGYPELKPKGSLEMVTLAKCINLRRAKRIRVEQALRDSELRLKANYQMMPLAAIETDPSNKILNWNLAAEQMFGYAAEEALGRDVLELIVPEGIRSEIFDFIERINLGEPTNNHFNRNLTKSGREIECEWRNAPLYDSRGKLTGWASLVKDITAEHAEAEKILYLSRHDPLTGLLNRRSMQEKMDEEWQRCKRTGGNYTTVMLDADNFKKFNDRNGHECGDIILKAITDAMTETVRSTDCVGRWGGEEFLILLPATDGEGGLQLAEKIRKRIEWTAIAYGEESYKITVTAGVATSRGGERTDDCVRRADEALFIGKDRGRNRVVASE
jgi:diguanylate cyclase (GGDEF)-like protein/PAS domain S-box-containing protein